jgi:hypothetical protein
MAELVDAHDSKSCFARSEGSSPSPGTMVLMQWVFFYVAPAVLFVSLARLLQPIRYRMLTVHIGVGVSILLLSITGVRLFWSPSVVPATLLTLSFLLALYLLGSLGLLYLLSSMLQEVCILLAGTLIVSMTGIVVASVLTALVFAFAHDVDFSNWRWKFPLTFIGGVFSIMLYLLLRQPLLNIALHASLGVILIHAGFLYQKRAQVDA